MSDQPKKLSDREIIEQRRQQLMEEVQKEHQARAVSRIARAGVCLSIRRRTGEQVLRDGDWEPSPLSRSLARDPNAPADLLLLLSRHLADDVLDNPTLPLLLVENPGVLQDAQPEQLAALARSPKATPALLDAVFAVGQGSEPVRSAIASHPATPPALLRRLTSDPVEEVRTAALRNPSLGPDKPGGLAPRA